MANDNTLETHVFPVNENGELVLTLGSGSSNIVGNLPSGFIPVDPRTNRMKAVFGPTANESASLDSPLTFYVKEGSIVKFVSNTTSGTITKYVGNTDTVDLVQTVLAGNNFLYGPYTGDQKFIVTANNGSIDAILQSNTTAFFRPGGNMAFMGDSIVQRAYGGTTTANAGFIYNYTNAFGWVKWALELSGQAYNMGRMAAQPSSGSTSFTANVHPTSQEQLGNVLSDTSITDVFFCSGINDLQADCPVATLISAVEPIFDSIIASGRVLHIGTILPLNSTYGAYTVARQGAVLAYNTWIKNLVNRYGKRVIIYDLYKVAVDDASKTSSMKTGYSFDNLHPRNLGAYFVGKAVAAQWVAQGRQPLPLISSAGDAKVDNAGVSMMPLSTNILQNGMFNLGTPSGGVAPNWTLVNGGASSSTATVIANPKGPGSAQQIAATFVNNGDFLALTSDSFVARIPSINSSKLRAKARVTVTGTPVNFKNVRMELLCNGNVNPSFIWSFPDTNDIALTEGFTGIMVADLNLADWGVTALGGGAKVIFTISSVGGAGSATIQISEVSVDVI